MYERNIRIMGRLFGTDGARGVAITELTCEMAMQIGRAAALVLTKEAKHRAKIFIGKDTRISSDILEAALCAGICSVGAEAVKLGVVPTHCSPVPQSVPFRNTPTPRKTIFPIWQAVLPQTVPACVWFWTVPTAVPPQRQNPCSLVWVQRYICSVHHRTAPISIRTAAPPTWKT